MKGKPCRDCPPGSKRPAPHPGPRCSTHSRAARKRARDQAHARRLETVYGIDAGTYAALLELQGGRCAICQRATGAVRRLAVDHDHKQAALDGHDPEKGCPRCVRGLLCKSCNSMLARMRDDPLAFLRAEEYLRVPPMTRLLRSLRSTGNAPNASAAADSGSASPGSCAAGAPAPVG